MAEWNVQGKMRRVVKELIFSWPVHSYASIASLNTGYGFFAPQVGSPYLLEVKAFPASQKPNQQTARPVFRHPEGNLRYQNFLEVFQDLMEASPDKDIRKRYARALAKSIAARLARDQVGANVQVRISVYGQAKLCKADRSHPMAYLVPIYQHEFPIIP